MDTKPTTILIIDDDPLAHKLLKIILQSAGYQVEEAYSGKEGLDLAIQIRPDLILLDIMMPEMSGFEVVGQLKTNNNTAEAPVIFLSAKVESRDKVKALELGAADFVNKPFDRAELLARIRTQLKLKTQEEALREYSQNLEKMVEERTRLLVHADRLASLGALSAGIAHEINNPTTFITGNLQTMEQFWKKVKEFIEPRLTEEDKNKKISYILNEFPLMIQSIRSGADRIANIVSGLKAFSRKDSPEKDWVDIALCIDEALQLTHTRFKYFIKIDKNLPDDLPPIWANAQQMVQVMVNLLVNAADSIGDRSGAIGISAKRVNNDQLEISITDNGAGIPDKILPKIFDPFYTTKPIGEGTGLGLSITHGIIIDHKGSINVESKPGFGTTFAINLPTEHP